MRLRPFAEILSIVLLLAAAALGAVGAFSAWADGAGFAARTFLLPGAAALGLGLGLRFLGNERGRAELPEREAVLGISAGWVLVPILGAIPYLMSDAGPFDLAEHGWNVVVFALFESFAGFTTTGATVMGADRLPMDEVPAGILLWRSASEWIGGGAAVVFSAVVLDRVLGGGLYTFGPSSRGASMHIRPRLAAAVKALGSVYLGLTGIGLLALLATRVPVGEAVHLTLSAVSTGGFSPRGSLEPYSRLASSVVTLLSLAGGLNFVLVASSLRQPSQLVRSPEVRLYLLLLALATALLTLRAVQEEGEGAGIVSGLLGAWILASSVVSTSGFATGVSVAGPDVLAVLTACAFIGGNTGSTAGGLKTSRLLVLLKAVWREVQLAIHPRAVIPVRYGGVPVEEGIVRNLAALFTSLVVMLVVSTILLTFMGLTLTEASIVGVQCLSNTGMTGAGLGTPAALMDFPSVGLIWLSVMMWAGRMELLAAVMVLLPRSYA